MISGMVGWMVDSLAMRQYVGCNMLLCDLKNVLFFCFCFSIECLFNNMWFEIVIVYGNDEYIFYFYFGKKKKEVKATTTTTTSNTL